MVNICYYLYIFIDHNTNLSIIIKKNYTQVWLDDVTVDYVISKI